MRIARALDNYYKNICFSIHSSTDGGVTKHSDGLRVTAPTLMWVKVGTHIVYDVVKHAALISAPKTE